MIGSLSVSLMYIPNRHNPHRRHISLTNNIGEDCPAVLQAVIGGSAGHLFDRMQYAFQDWRNTPSRILKVHHVRDWVFLDLKTSAMYVVDPS